MRRLSGLALAILLLSRAGEAQTPRPAVVVQVAGATLYLNVGSDSGLRAGDTLAVRRQAAGPTVGALTVLAATPTRAVLGFAGPAFPITRGDTIHLTPQRGGESRAGASAAGVAVTTPGSGAPPSGSVADRSSAPRWRREGSMGAELWGSHTETIGLGADPVRSTRDIGIPALRLNGIAQAEQSRFRVNLRAEQRAGPATVWDRQTRLRVYEARFDRSIGAAQLTAGRFYSDFDHQSAFWDGVSLRVAASRAWSFGAAAGFEPARGNEEPSFETPKVAGYVGLRRGDARYDISGDFALTQTLPQQAAQRRSGADLALRLRIGRVSISQDLEAAPPAASLGWELSRVALRASAPVGPRGQAYASAVSDRFTPLDTAFLLPFTRRERVTAGYSLSTAGGGFVDINATVNDPRGDRSGYALGSTVAWPNVLPTATALMHGTWFDDGLGTGLLMSPALEYRLRGARLRGGYQFFYTSYPAYAAQTHGIDLRIWKPLGARSAGVLQLTERLGAHQRSTTLFSSFEWRF